MGNSENQLGLFGNKTHVLELPDASLAYTPEFYSIEAADALFQEILSNTDWRQEEITVYGKKHLTPRLSCLMGDSGLNYTYSHTKIFPVGWHDTLLKIKTNIEAFTGDAFNSVLINNYRDGQDSNGWHSDDEPELGEQPVIASISLGAERDFQLRHKTTKRKEQLRLAHGSLLMMRGKTQRCWQHCVPKRAQAEERINLTYRLIKNRP